MWLLDEPQITPEAVKVNLDYYRTLNEGIFQAQKHVCDMARAKCGAGAIFGTHHTWVGEGGIGDFRAGAVDYFRLNENMDAGYTDGVWWFDGCIDYVYALGASLGRLTSWQAIPPASGFMASRAMKWIWGSFSIGTRKVGWWNSAVRICPCSPSRGRSSAPSRQAWPSRPTVSRSWSAAWTASGASSSSLSRPSPEH